jgi:hypothetical protein
VSDACCLLLVVECFFSLQAHPPRDRIGRIGRCSSVPNELGSSSRLSDPDQRKRSCTMRDYKVMRTAWCRLMRIFGEVACSTAIFARLCHSAGRPNWRPTISLDKEAAAKRHGRRMYSTNIRQWAVHEDAHERESTRNAGPTTGEIGRDNAAGLSAEQ